MEKKIEISKEELYDLYINKNLTQTEIAEIKEVSVYKVKKDLAKYEIKKPKELFYIKVREKVKQKYGVENISQIKEVKEKVKETVLKKYGVDNISKSIDIKNKKEKKL